MLNCAHQVTPKTRLSNAFRHHLTISALQSRYPMRIPQTASQNLTSTRCLSTPLQRVTKQSLNFRAIAPSVILTLKILLLDIHPQRIIHLTQSFISAPHSDIISSRSINNFTNPCLQCWGDLYYLSQGIWEAAVIDITKVSCKRLINFRLGTV